MKAGKSLIADIIRTHEDEILAEWVGEQKKGLTRSGDKISEPELQRDSAKFLRALVDSLKAGDGDTAAAHWKGARDTATRCSTA